MLCMDFLDSSVRIFARYHSANLETNGWHSDHYAVVISMLTVRDPEYTLVLFCQTFQGGRSRCQHQPDYPL
jgi:hypothetical protein